KSISCKEEVMKKAKAGMALIVSLGFISHVWAATERENAQKRLQSAAEVLQEVMNTPDKGIPEEVVKSAKCIAVIPHQIKGGFIFGGTHGKGVATCRTPKG